MITYSPKSTLRQDATTTTARIIAAHRGTLPNTHPSEGLIETPGRPIYILGNDLERPHPQGGMLISGDSLEGRIWQSAKIQVIPGQKYVLTYDAIPYIERIYWLARGAKTAVQDWLPPLYSGIRQLQFIPNDEVITISLFVYGSSLTVKNIAWVKSLRLDAFHD